MWFGKSYFQVLNSLRFTNQQTTATIIDISVVKTCKQHDFVILHVLTWKFHESLVNVRFFYAKILRQKNYTGSQFIIYPLSH